MFAIVAGYLLVGPVLSQVFGVRVSGAFPRWRMFTGKGSDVCQVEYTLVQLGGSRRPLDRRELLAPARDGERSRLWRVTRDQLDLVNRQMCRKVRTLERRDVDIRLRARCGSRRRWILEHRGDRNVCAP